jgi:hypothetical protein
MEPAFRSGAIEAEIECATVRDTQNAVANKIPYKQLNQQK